MERTPKQPQDRHAVPQTVPRDDFEAVVARIKEPYRAMMVLQRALGMRPGEVCRLRFGDVRLDTGELVTPRDGKTGERRLYFDANGRCAHALRDWIAIRPGGPFMFGDGQPIRVNTYHVAITRWCERLGVAAFKPYALRHTYACEMMDSGQPIASISAALGHKNVLTTCAFYLHPNPDIMRRMNAGR
jgi:integrase